MGELISLDPRRERSEAIKALRVLLHKVQSGEVTGFAFVALKRTGACGGLVNIRNRSAALSTLQRLEAAITGCEEYLELIL